MKQAIATGPVEIYGASDDLIEIEGGVSEELNRVRSPQATVTFGRRGTDADAGHDDGGVIVKIRYAPKWHSDGVWTAEIAQLGDEVPIPWPVSVRHGMRTNYENGRPVQGTGYSVIVRVECPAGTPVSW